MAMPSGLRASSCRPAIITPTPRFLRRAWNGSKHDKPTSCSASRGRAHIICAELSGVQAAMRRPGLIRFASTLSIRRPSRSTTSNRQPLASMRSPVFGMC